VPIRGLSRQFQKAEDLPESYTLGFSDLSGGVGTRWGKEERTDPRSLLGYWYGTLDTWNPGQVTLPLLSTSTTPTNISALKTDYASMIECYIGGATRVILVKGTKAWNTTAASFGAEDKTLTDGQGRQLLYVACQPVTGALQPAVFWIAGPDAYVQKTLDGSTWADQGATPKRVAAYCGWTQILVGGTVPYVMVIAKSEATGVDHVVHYLEADGNWTSTGVGRYVPPATSTGVIALGALTELSTAYLLNGPHVWELKLVSGAYSIAGMYPTGLADGKAGCRYEDMFALTDGSRIILWHPTRPPQDVSIWQDDGCPDDMAGEVKALQSLGPYLIAYWEFNNAAPVPTAWRGDTMIFWSRPNLQGQTTWHPRSGILTGGFPLSIGSPMVMAEHTVSGYRYFWACTADTSNGRAYYQVHPFSGLNPNATSGGLTMSREDGYHYLYTRWEDLILAGNEAGAITEAEVNAKFPTSDELISLDYRGDYENYAEQGASVGWEADLKFKDTRPHIEVGAGRGTQADAFQFKLGMDRGATATNTPSLFDLAVTVERQTRHPSKRRS